MACAACCSACRSPAVAAGPTLLNVSYDVAREFYKDYNAAFVKHWKTDRPAKTSTVNQSHGGSSKQARAVIDGLEADVVTMNQAQRHRRHRRARQLRAGRLGQAPAQQQRADTSTTVILVRKGNPKGIKDWADLAKPGVSGRHPEPEDHRQRPLHLPRRLGLGAQGGRRRRRRRASCVQKIFANVPVFDGGGRAATDHLRAARHRRCAGHVRERGAPDHGASSARNFDVVYPPCEHPRREPGRGGRQGGRQEGHAQAGRGLPEVPVVRRRRRRSPPSTSCARARRRCCTSTRRTSRR